MSAFLRSPLPARICRVETGEEATFSPVDIGLGTDVPFQKEHPYGEEPKGSSFVPFFVGTRAFNRYL